MASLSSSGFEPISAAIAGSDVAMTVESMFSMNRATATISGTRRSRVMDKGLGVAFGPSHRHRSWRLPARLHRPLIGRIGQAIAGAGANRPGMGLAQLLADRE